MILDFGCWILDAGYWMLDTGCWILDAGCWMLDKIRITSFFKGRHPETSIKHLFHK
jgi:hypothetical protein